MQTCILYFFFCKHVLLYVYSFVHLHQLQLTRNDLEDGYAYQDETKGGMQ